MTYGDRPRLLAQIVIDYADGSTQTIATDSSWRAGEGPIRASDMLMGEDYDARREIPGWTTTDFDDSSWRPVVTSTIPASRSSRTAPHPSAPRASSNL
jgi:alpha-L-rhamnosidase